MAKAIRTLVRAIQHYQKPTAIQTQPDERFDGVRRVESVRGILLILASDRKRRALLAVSTLLACTGPSICLILLSYVIGGLVDGVVDYTALWLFLAVATLSAGALHLAVRQCGSIAEKTLQDKRLSMEQAISTIDLAQLERIGKAHVQDVFALDFGSVSSAARRIPPIVTSAGSLVLSAFAILLFAPWIFLLFLVVFAIGGAAALIVHRRLVQSISRTRTAARHHNALLRHLLDGAKEIRLNQDRRDDILTAHITPALVTLRQLSVEEIKLSGGVVFIFNFFSWASLFVIVAVLPLYVDDMSVVIQALYVGIFVRTYMFGLVVDLPELFRLTSALTAIEHLEAALAQARRPIAAAPKPVPPEHKIGPDFQRIRANAVSFSYGANGEDQFTLGPLTVDIRKGRTVFLVGANGAGKSTFLKLLASLYAPASGQLIVDDVIVDDTNKDTYRQLYSCVFSDFHLFDRLYGLTDVPDDKVRALLAEYALADRVSVTDGVFSTTDLSSGQRQRLALVVAILEGRPILVLDEIAADQDPNFRRRIYHELIPAWREAGRTLIVVSHDDRFFDLADTLVTFDNGSATVEHRER